MASTKIQMRGVCQICGREHAVVSSGKMSKHGYTVDNGWFNGVCSGQHHKPLNKDRSALDRTLFDVAQDVAKFEENLKLAEEGVLLPKTAKESNRYKAADVPFCDAPAYMQEQAVTVFISQIKSRIRAGQQYIEMMSALADRVHGTALREVVVEAGPAPIQYGERRVNAKGDVLVVTSVQGARVYWKRERDGAKSWTGTGAFRKLELV